MNHDVPVFRFARSSHHDLEIRTTLGYALERAADLEEVLATTASIEESDHEGWIVAWQELATRTVDIANTAAADGHRLSASETYLRASAYYSVVVKAIAALSDDRALLPAFREQRGAWESFVALTSVRAERVDIPFELSSLPGYFFRPPKDHATASTLVAVNSGDGSLAGLWANCAAAGLRRGYNVLVFDGPGQQSQLYERNVPFRPDWENILTPVYDYVSRLQGIDPARIGIYGLGQGAHWVARALAFEHRYAAAITDPGIVDVSAPWTDALSQPLLRLLDEGKTDTFDEQLGAALALSPESARTWRLRARPYGREGFAETIEAVRQHSVADIAPLIRTPLLIADSGDQPFWPGQADQLAQLSPKVSTVARFSAAEGAGGRCRPLSRTVATQRMLDWLDERLLP